jgi:hypothetical protein
MLKGIISEMPADQQAKVHEAAEKLRAVTAEYGDAGLIALALVGIEKSE